MKGYDLLNLIHANVEAVPWSFEDSECPTGIDPLDAVDPFTENFLWERDGGLGENTMVVVCLDEPLNMAGFNVIWNVVELICIAGLA